MFDKNCNFAAYLNYKKNSSLSAKMQLCKKMKCQ